MQILIGLTEHHLNRETHNTETQTTSVPPYRESLGKCNLCKQVSSDTFILGYGVALYKLYEWCYFITYSDATCSCDE